MVLLAALALSASAASQDLELRPWAKAVPLRFEIEEERKDADEPAELLALARRCDELGLFDEYSEALDAILAQDADHAGARAALGYVPVGDGWSFEELARFAETSEPLAFPSIDAGKRKKLLKARDADFDNIHTGSFYELWSDLDYGDVRAFSQALTDQYKRFRATLKFPAQDKVDVYLFGSRSEFLAFYRSFLGRSGLHSAGVYIPSFRRLVFYDDPFDPEGAINTARHECTHAMSHLSFGGAPLPKWFEEGIACFYAAGGEAAEGRYTAGLFVGVLQRIRSDTATPLDTLLHMPADKFGGEHYPESWAWVHFLHATRGKRDFGEFLRALRDRTTPEQDRSSCAMTTAEVLRDAYADDWYSLEGEWERYFVDEFALKSPRQLVDFGWIACNRARGLNDREDAERMLAMGQRAFASVPPDAFKDGGVELAFARVGQLVGRTDLEVDTLDTTRVALRAIRDTLNAIPDGVDDARKGHWAVSALYALARITPIRQAANGGGDFRSSQVTALARDGDDEREERQAVIVLYDEILAIAQGSLSRALTADPLHRDAARNALWIAADFDPTALASVFAILRLQVEVDPDDHSLAALAVAYARLGDVAWARMVLDEAEAISAEPSTLGVYRDYID